MIANVHKGSDKRTANVWLSFLFSISAILLSGNVLAQSQDDLQSIQQQIKSKQAAIYKQLAAAKKIQNNLQKEELKIASTAKQLNQTQISLANIQQQQKQLLAKQKAHLASIDKQKSALAKQIKSAYMTGDYDFAKMLLNQQSAANFERTITYYQYLNKARKSQIELFNGLVEELQIVNAELIEKQQELETLKKRQLSQQKTLTTQQTAREKTLKQLRASIQSDESKVAQLQINEKNLIDAIAKAAAAAKALAESKKTVTLAGLSAHKGRLIKPAEGRLRKMFGRLRQGQIKWKGIVIYGEEGSAVVAIHDAKVLYSDWLRGFGLVTVLDHGNGYMSLYGHNQALLKQAGDTVRAGESIALLGQSGGQSQPNLYFEIRHKGKPINPTSWLK
ncbi:peptidoglycan DD-metalloendopeptidase family protein [Paraglaciecola aquimarina]|uniref:Peptidoglycan DD-metalloendopeptidase family protein n=1 Tax=Paraglaciecola aquimarina TaxID=1235557 RepID=A0ABU3T1W2_9ALTE|nr:peptidoglycan DD-metalloendopeptidase family protein [Paraglaciecola aquimarina]MDU0356257.1 peptidoglycan DD-metalloendopeptidase family protein [Paraglaciecola aquimarina]